MPRFAALLLLLGASVAACTASVPSATVRVDPAPEQPAPAPRLLNVDAAEAPAPGTVATTVLQESPAAVSRIMRLAPGAVIPEHHHPAHDEAFFVHRGTVTAVLDGQEHVLGAGDLVYIPARTVIAGRNSGAEEAVVIVVFSSTGAGGPLTIPGPPHH
jgi:quercetin dioxygenase-like cupin family protein